MLSRTASLAGLVLVLTTALAGCSGDEEPDRGSSDPSDQSGTPATSSGDPLADATALLPATTTDLEFVDRLTAAERAGVAGPDVPVQDYVAASREGLPMTDLGSVLATADEAGVALDERSVLWSAEASYETDDESSRSVTLLRVAGNVDLDALADELEAAGLTPTELEGRVRLTGSSAAAIDPVTATIAGGYPASWYDVTIDDEAGLVVVGSGVEGVLAVADGDAPALTSGPVFDVVDALRGSDLVQATFAPRCGALVGDRVTPEQLEQLEAEAPDFGRPVVAGLGEGPDGRQVRLLMADEEEAATDVPVRQAYLDDGLLRATGEPVSEAIDAAVSQDGSTVVVDVELADGVPPTYVRQLALGSDGPFAC